MNEMSSSKKSLNGKVTKRVECAGCGRSYEYDLTRTVTGSSPKNAATRAEADAQALEDATKKLQAALANDCDPVACPACGAFTKQMKTYRWKRFGAALACTGVGVGILLVVFLFMVVLHRILIVGVLGGGVCLLLGLVLAAVSAIDLVAPKKGRL